MEECCAVCAEPLEWVAYGACLHREVCSTCVVRLRFILNDPRCCLCKSPSPSVFVTRAMGEYTKVISDFSVLPPGASEGRVAGEYWYHEDSQAYFDDADHYRMVKAMCRLSCAACGEDREGAGGRVRTRFRNIQQLKGHLFHKHKLFMCSLCLEGRKVFICEQKLYTRSQLNQHISTGDSEVDGSESERGGFSGHPMCEFCKTPFYGDNELYTHMTRDHYTCHICQRRNPGHYDYFKTYDDLEVHFRQEHFLCEDEACLAEKFVVFSTEAELKRHNAIKHGGNMSRSKRNAALVLPTSFRFRPTSGQERRGRTYRYYTDSPAEAFAFGHQSSSQISNVNGRNHDSSSSGPTSTEPREGSQINAITGSFDSLNVSSDVGPPLSSQTTARQMNAVLLEETGFPALSEREAPESSLRYAQVLSTNGPSHLREASFPPLPGAAANNPPERRSSGSSFAARTTNASTQGKSVSKVPQWSGVGRGSESSTSANSSQGWRSIQSSFSSSARPVLPTTLGVAIQDNVTNHVKPSRGDRFSTSGSSSKTDRLNHSSSAPDLVSSGRSQIAGDLQSANKSLVEKIRSALGMDEDRFSAFKSISAEYRQGLIGAAEYVFYAHQFGLSHLIVDLAQLCPDARKQKELIDIYKANLQLKQPTENGSTTSSSRESKKSKKEKGKSVGTSESSSASAKLTDDILNTVKKLHENYRPQDEHVELLSKDGYRTAKGRSVSAPGRELTDANYSSIEANTNHITSGQDPGGANSKQRKKTSKFHRVRLGDGSAAALYDLTGRNVSPERPKESSSSQGDGLPVHGVWRNGGGQRLFGTSSKGPSR